MLAATLEQERKKIYRKGEAAGLAKGETKGRIKTQQEMIGQLLRFRFELAEAEQHGHGQQVAKIQEFPYLDELVNTLLNKTTTFEDFTRLLAKYLLADKVA